VFDKVTVAYRGTGYEIGRGRDFYGIWTAGGSRSQPLERWPETPDGWSAAWTRFTEMEEPSTIAPADRNAAPVAGNPVSPGVLASGGSRLPVGGSRVGAALLLVAGVALGVAGLFPTYLTGSTLAQQPPQLIPHVIYLATWTASAVLIMLGGSRLRIGALLGTGLSAVTFGLYLADAGTPISGGAHLAGAGMVLTIIGWFACAAGSVLALLQRPADVGDAGIRARLGRLEMPRGPAVGPAVLLVLAGLGAAVAFAPSWDSYTLRTATGQTQYLTAGNAFSNPGPVIAGDVLVMIALAAAVIAAALWRPVRHGAVLLAGAAIPMVAQAISAVVAAGEATAPQQFGLTPAQANQLGLTISNGLTPVFWVYCAFVIALAVSCLWMLSTPQAPLPAQPVPADTPAPAAQGEDPTWNSDAYAWYAAPSDPIKTGSWASSAPAPTPSGTDTTQPPTGHAAPETDQPS
jgi:hypothetical protein